MRLLPLVLLFFIGCAFAAQPIKFKGCSMPDKIYYRSVGILEYEVICPFPTISEAECLESLPTICPMEGYAQKKIGDLIRVHWSGWNGETNKITSNRRFSANVYCK